MFGDLRLDPAMEGIILADEHLGESQLNKRGVLVPMKAWNYSSIP